MPGKSGAATGLSYSPHKQTFIAPYLAADRPLIKPPDTPLNFLVASLITLYGRFRPGPKGRTAPPDQLLPVSRIPAAKEHFAMDIARVNYPGLKAGA